MSKVFFGILLGVLIGGTAAWLYLAHRLEPAKEKGEQKEEKAASDLIKIDAQQQANAGIQTALPEATELKPEVKGYGRVLDPTPLVSVALEIQSAQAALEASSKEYARLKTLYAQNQITSARALETGEAAMKRDQLLLNAARAKLVTAWGSALVQRKDFEAMLEPLSKLEWALLRLDLPADRIPEANLTAATIAPLSDQDRRFHAEVLGPATTAETQLQGIGFLLLVKTNALPPGTAVTGWMPVPGGSIQALVVPRTALLQQGNANVVLVQTAPDSFKPAPVSLERMLENGWAITNGLAATNRIVISGAQQILSEATKGEAAE